MKKKSNSARATLPVITDAYFLRGNAKAEFFDKEGHYVGEIMIWTDGEIWVDAGDINKEFKFKTPQEFFQALHRGKTQE